jgi:glycerol-3-phosphate dehydrogenase
MDYPENRLRLLSIHVGTGAMNGLGSKLKTQVLIIGGGIAGMGLARDLALRGVKSLVVEKGHINAGASGANHGLLHSGGRYVSNDPVTARECGSESRLLKRLAPGCIEDTGGLFVAVAGDNENYIADFPGYCERSGIAAHPIGCREARDIEPELSEDIIAACLIEDATVDPFRLSFDNMADAAAHGAESFTHTRVIGMTRAGNRIESVRIRRLKTGEEIDVEPEQVVNAAGAWVGEVAELAGFQLPVVWSKGSLIVTQRRMTERVINRLRPPNDGDIIVPGGTVSLAGTTSVRVTDIEHLRADFSEVDFLVDEAARLLPSMRNARLMRAFAGVRPLFCSSEVTDDRCISRGSEILSCEETGLTNLTTVVNSKLTTYRLTAERAADMVCARLGVTAPCLTGELPLPNSSAGDWVLAGHAPKVWRHRKDTNDALVCECEMVPASAVRELVSRLHADGERVELDAIRLRSRMGKGSCQGAFCGFRTTALLYELGVYREDEGLQDLRGFLEARWKGLRPVLWGTQMVQEQLQEAIHCASFNLEQVR